MIHLRIALDGLKKRLFHLSSLVEENLKLAIKALHECDLDLARRVREQDREIDRLEVEVEEECLKILALHQPVAVDLRFLVAVLKMNNDLERIGDLAVNIAGCKAIAAREIAPGHIGARFRELAEKSRAMVRQSLEALMNLDAEQARAVLRADNQVDEDYHALLGELKKHLAAHPEKTEVTVSWLMAAKHIERIADQATNIAEDTIYTVDGEIVRHQGP